MRYIYSLNKNYYSSAGNLIYKAPRKIQCNKKKIIEKNKKTPI